MEKRNKREWNCPESNWKDKIKSKPLIIIHLYLYLNKVSSPSNQTLINHIQNVKVLTEAIGFARTMHQWSLSKVLSHQEHNNSYCTSQLWQTIMNMIDSSFYYELSCIPISNSHTSLSFGFSALSTGFKRNKKPNGFTLTGLVFWGLQRIYSLLVFAVLIFFSFWKYNNLRVCCFQSFFSFCAILFLSTY